MAIHKAAGRGLAPEAKPAGETIENATSALVALIARSNALLGMLSSYNLTDKQRADFEKKRDETQKLSDFFGVPTDIKTTDYVLINGVSVPDVLVIDPATGASLVTGQLRRFQVQLQKA
jgi:hypothetical protein